MKPANSKPMSILSDLDPENARFREHPQGGKRSKATWFLALVPLLGAIWIFFSFQSAMTANGEKSAVTAIRQDQGTTERPAALTVADPAPLSAAAEAVSPVPEKAMVGAALILAAASPKNYGQSERASDGDAFPAVQPKLEQAASKATKPKKSHGKVKSAASGSAKKTSQASAPSRVPRNSGSQAERDIDIITAIVR